MKGKRSNLADELWFRFPYRALLKDKRLKLIIKPGDRRYPNPKGFKEHQKVRLRVLQEPGAEKWNLLPIFDGFEARARILKIVVKELGWTRKAELKFASPDCQSRELIKYHLGLIYNQEFSYEDIISLIHFEYI